MSPGFQQCCELRGVVPGSGYVRGSGRWRGRLPWLLRLLLCHLLPAWCLMAVLAASASASSDVPAPMCAPNAASIAATEEVPEVERARFEALPCEAQLLLSRWQLDAPELGRKAVSVSSGERTPPPPPPPPSGRDDAASGAAPVLLGRCGVVAVQFGAVAGLAPRLGHPQGLFRPPSQRA